VIFYDSKGTQVVACGDGPNIPGYINRWAKDIARIEVQERPYSYVDFDRVAFDPQETPKGYRGQEGRDHTIDTPIGKVVGVLKPTHDGAWVGSLLYATDGVRWLDPEPSLAGMEQGMFDPWDHPADNRRSILIEPNEALVASKTPTKIEIFAADSPDGPNQERLTIWDELPLRLPISEISCNPTERPYMRLDVRVGDGDWRTIETIPITDKMLNVAKRGVYGTRVLEVSCLSNGGISTWKDQPKPIPSPSKWRPDQEIVRVVARLHDGQTLEVNFNEAGGSPTNAVSFRGLALTRQAAGTYIPSGAKNLDIRDISALEIQVQDLKHPVAIPLHTPIR
jgi:hypothetical protein